MSPLQGPHRTVLENATYDITKLSPEQLTKLQSPGVLDAISRLEAYVTKAC